MAKIERGAPLSLRQFVLSAWHILESRQYVPGWHIEAMMELLEAVTVRQVQRVVINVPPGSMKSLLTNVFWPSWEWAERDAGNSWLFGTYAAKLALRDAVKMRKLLTSTWYSTRYGDRFRLSRDENTKARFANTAGGMRIATSVGGSGIGERVQTVVIDDPQAASKIYTVARSNANEWLKSDMSTRGSSPEDFAVVIIMQRLHENDMSGFALAEMSDFQHFFIPARYEPARSCRIVCNGYRFDDPRTEAGEIFWKEKYNDKTLAALERDLGGQADGQLQQRPSKAGGEMMQETAWSFWQPDDVAELPAVELRSRDGEIVYKKARIVGKGQFVKQFQSWDMTFKAKSDSDYVVGTVWGKLKTEPANAYLLDLERARASFTETLKRVHWISKRWPAAATKYVEDKANGSAIIDALQDHIGGFVPVEPRGNKIERAEAVMWMLLAGNVYLPHPAIAPWVTGFIQEWNAFPKGANDDQVDSTTQALLQLNQKDPLDTPALSLEAMTGGLLR